MNKLSQKEEIILSLCNQLLSSIRYGEHSIHIPTNLNQFSLLLNGIKFHDLNYRELQTASVHLLRTLCPNQTIMLPSADHYFYWAWCCQLIRNNSVTIFENSPEIESLFQCVIHLVLAPYLTQRTRFGSTSIFNVHGSNFDAASSNQWIQEGIVRRAHLILSYIGFPLLEATCKIFAREYISRDGKVLKTFSRFKNKDWLYKPERDICSNLSDILYLTYEHCIDSTIKYYIDEYLAHVKLLSGPDHPFLFLFKIRNQSLHGEQESGTIFGVILHLVFILLISRLSSEYDSARDRETACMEVARNFGEARRRLPRADWEIYPP